MINVDTIKWFWGKVVDNLYHTYIILTLLSALAAIASLQNKDVVYYILLVFMCSTYIFMWWAYYQTKNSQVRVANDKVIEANDYVSRLDKHVNRLNEEYISKQKYWTTLEQLHKAVHFSRDTYRYLEACQVNKENTVALTFERSRFNQLLSDCLNAYCNVFNLLTDSTNRAAIKIIGHGSDGMNYVQTLARDSHSASDCKDQDALEGNKHKINSNTDYKKIVERQINYFFSNDLESEGQSYENSSFPASIDQYVSKGGKWLLPYRSTLVVPIRYVYHHDDLPNDGDILDKRRDQTIYGFLTIDSNKKDAYEEKASAQIGAILADTLFPVLQSLRRKKSADNANSK